MSIFTVTLLIERFMYYRSAAAGNANELIEKIKRAKTLGDAFAAIEQHFVIAARDR